jgi:N-acetylglucosamine-6-sulfatase
MASAETKSPSLEVLLKSARSRQREHAWTRILAVALIAVASAAPAGCGGGSSPKVPVSTRPSAPTAPARSGAPNIVFILTDDLSIDLLRFMPHVRAMERLGLTFSDYFVSDSLCCPSRASIFTGDFPHDTRVFGNFGPNAGFHTFYRRREELHTFAVALQHAGYLTAMMGKYLNGYMERRGHIADGSTTDIPANYVPPGWSEWDVAGWGYPEFGYTLNEDGRLRRYGHRPSDYLTDVLARKGIAFIKSAARSGRPFFLELATFAPHYPYVPAPRNARDFAGLQAPRPRSFDVLPTHAPQWLAAHPPLTSRQEAQIDRVFRLRAQSVEAVDRMIGEIQRQLRASGIAGSTYIVFSSDNGLHTGQYRLMPGKLTALDTDIRVPLVVTGPGVPAGTSTAKLAENVDLAETFAAIAGTRLDGDGHSLLALWHGKSPGGWRNAALVEHRGSRLSVLDPDFQQSASGSPTTYEAMRTRSFLYVEYADGEREFYDLRTDPFELHNIADQLTRRQLRLLHTDLRRLKRCHGGSACWRAMHVPALPGSW